MHAEKEMNTEVYLSIHAMARTAAEHLFITQVYFHPQQKKLSIVTEYHKRGSLSPSTFTSLSPVVVLKLPQGVSTEELCQQIVLYTKNELLTIETVSINFQIKRQVTLVNGSYQPTANDSLDTQTLYNDDSAYREQRIVDMVSYVESIPRYLAGRNQREKEQFPNLSSPSADSLVKDLSAKFKNDSMSEDELEFYKGILYVYDLINKRVSNNTLVKSDAEIILQRLHIDKVDFEAGKYLDFQPKPLEGKTSNFSPYSFWNQHKVELTIGAAALATVALSKLILNRS